MTWPDTRLCELLGTRHPLVQAPMLGVSTPAMAAAAIEAGALGSLGCAGSAATRLEADVNAARQAPDEPLNLNFFAHSPPAWDPDRIASARNRLLPWFERLGAGEIPETVETPQSFDDATCSATVELAPRVASFHFGLPEAKLVDRLKGAGILVLSSATSVREARWLEERGADAIIVQGYEAGGHRGWFLEPAGDTASTLTLVPRVVDAVSVPVIAAGGTTDGRGVAAALTLGAAGAQLGTAFVATVESAASAAYQQALVAASGDDTMTSRAFSGGEARTLTNDFASEMSSVDEWPDFPLMNSLTRPLRAASSERDLPDAISLWSGQGAGLVTEISTTGDVIDGIVTQCRSIFETLGSHSPEL